MYLREGNKYHNRIGETYIKSRHLNFVSKNKPSGF